MKIQISADSRVEHSEQSARHAGAVVESRLGHLTKHVTSVKIHLGDENGEKGGDHDKRCTMEARLKGRRPMAVRHVAETIDQAIGGAADKLRHSLDHTLGRLRDRWLVQRKRPSLFSRQQDAGNV